MRVKITPILEAEAGASLLVAEILEGRLNAFSIKIDFMIFGTQLSHCLVK